VGVAENFSYTIVATGSPTITYGALNLPPGLTVDVNTGIISGIPLTQGVFPVTISAANTAGSDQKTLTITIAINPPVITSSLSVTTSTVQVLNYVLTATGQPPLTFSVTGLPAGLTFSGNTITGTPIATGIYTITLTASNPQGSDVETLTLTVTNDSDGDAFPDDLEIFLGKDPNDPNSNPFVGTGTVALLNITSASIKLNFAKPNQDTIAVKGTLSLDPAFNPAGKIATIYVSGVAANINLSAKANNAQPTFKRKFGGTKFVVPYTLGFGKGSSKPRWPRWEWSTRISSCPRPSAWSSRFS